MVNKAYVDKCKNKVYNDLERKFQTIPGYSTMFSNHVVYDTIEVNISKFKKRVNVIDYVDKVITGVHTSVVPKVLRLISLLAPLQTRIQTDIPFERKFSQLSNEILKVHLS
jgi:hypothetical protein